MGLAGAATPIRLLHDAHIINNGQLGEGDFDIWGGAAMVVDNTLEQIANPLPSTFQLQSNSELSKIGGAATTFDIDTPSYCTVASYLGSLTPFSFNLRRLPMFGL